MNSENNASELLKPSTESPIVPSETKEISKEDVIQDILAAFGDDAVFNDYATKLASQDRCKNLISKFLKQEVSRHACSADYNIVILHDSSAMIRADADKIYEGVKSFSDRTKPLLLVLHSNGGSGESAYLIGQLCREFSNGRFIVAIPRAAKSAATLLACAANEIHMGSLSELGPIDPQIDGMPVLGLKQAVEHIAELVKKTPEASEMFAIYLTRALKIIDLGYYERVAESAIQYAEKLLLAHANDLPSSATARGVANCLVHQYKDHGFVIDKQEATRILGDKIVKMNTKEYELANTIYQVFSTVERFLNFRNRKCYFIGSLDADLIIRSPSADSVVR